MRGVIVAGALPTAEVGAELLRRGGNAVDAAVGACFATAVGEPTLTSLAGGGVMIHRDAQSGVVEFCDFFADTPRRWSGIDGLDFVDVELDFGPATQTFFIGRGAGAVPGVIPGLCTVLERWGSMPLPAVIESVADRVRRGIVIDAVQARAVRLLGPILTHSAGGRAQFCADGRLLAEGDSYALPQLATTLESLARLGWRRYYETHLVPAMLDEFGQERGGVFVPEDFRDFEVAFRSPLSFEYRRRQIFTNPAPALGGQMVALMLALLQQRKLPRDLRGSAEHARLLSTVMRVADEARGAGALSLKRLPFWRARFDELLEVGAIGAADRNAGGNNSTTHISVIDEAGGAAAVTFSFGEGNGYIIGDTGIMMNNLMGELDLHPLGFSRTPAGVRLSTMMSPTLVDSPDGRLSVLGTGGANRIRSALLQVISNMVDFDLVAEEAVSAARVHFEEGVLSAEVHQASDGGDSLAALGAKRLVRFTEPNLFFGGVHLAQRAADGALGGAGDPRRGGVLRIA